MMETVGRISLLYVIAVSANRLVPSRRVRSFTSARRILTSTTRMWSGARSVTSSVVRAGTPPPVIISAPVSWASPVSWSSSRTSHVHSWCGCMSPFSDGVVHSNCLSIKFCSGHLVPGLCGVVNTLIVDEGKTPGSAGVTVKHNLNLLQRTKPAELFLQLLLSGVQTQSKDAKTTASFRLITVAGMATTRWHRRPRVVAPSPPVVVRSPRPRSRSCSGPPVTGAAPWPAAAAATRPATTTASPTTASATWRHVPGCLVSQSSTQSK